MPKTPPATAISRGFWSGLLARPYLILTLTPLFWGGNWVAGKLAVGHIEPIVLLTARFAGAVLAVLPFALPHLRRDWPLIRQNLPLLLGLGAVGFAAFNALMYEGAHYTSALNGAIEQAAIPMLVLIGSFIFFRIRAHWLQLLGVLLTIVGVALTAANGDLPGLLALTINSGDALVMLACVIYAGYSLALRYRPAIHWMSFLAVTLAGALLFSLLFQATIGGGLGRLAALGTTSAEGWAIIVYVALFPSIIAQLFYARGVELIGANRASLFINLIPVFGTILSVLIIGERMQTYHLVAGALVVAGIFLAEYSVRQLSGEKR